MLDAHLLRRDLAGVAAACARRGLRLDEALLESLEERRKTLQTEIEKCRALRNDRSRMVADLKKKGGNADSAIDEVTRLKRRIETLSEEFDGIRAKIDAFMLDIPNVLHDSVPDGKSADDNFVVRTHLEPGSFGWEPMDHVALGEGLRLIDFERAAAISGNRFVILRSALARLQRALIQYMLDKQTQENGYEEIYVPVLVNSDAMTGTGQLPKFEEDLFRAERDGLYLVPTAEVPVTNYVRDRILDEGELPLKFVCHAPCFRREAGSYGKDTRGMLRQHQFEKVELVHISHPDRSYDALEELTADAESILKGLGLAYRVVTLCSGDTGFAASKTYDIEVWLPGQQLYREISSCSNCEDFQARRMLARYRNADGKPRLVHTLNGSGIAVGRALIAVMENFQEEDGSIRIPETLVPYMGGAERIEVAK